jgi:hypothetical protein
MAIRSVYSINNFQRVGMCIAVYNIKLGMELHLKR